MNAMQKNQRKASSQCIYNTVHEYGASPSYRVPASSWPWTNTRSLQRHLNCALNTHEFSENEAHT